MGKKSVFILSIVFLIAAVGFIFQLYRIKERPVLGIDEYQFTQSDIDVAEAVEKFNYSSAPTGQGKQQLRKAAIYGALLKKLGNPVTDDELESELRRIESTTLMPGNWLKMKSLAPNRESLKKNIVFPILVFRKLPIDVFPRHPQIHEQRKGEVERVFQKLKTRSITWGELGKKERILSTCVYWRKKIDNYEEDSSCGKIKKIHGSSAFQGNDQFSNVLKERLMMRSPYESLGVVWTRQVASKIKTGEMIPILVETPDAFLAVKMVDKKNERERVIYARFIFVQFKKLTFEEWFENESRYVREHIL